jgi:hypothetical protein
MTFVNFRCEDPVRRIRSGAVVHQSSGCGRSALAEAARQILPVLVRPHPLRSPRCYAKRPGDSCYNVRELFITRQTRNRGTADRSDRGGAGAAGTGANPRDPRGIGGGGRPGVGQSQAEFWLPCQPRRSSSISIRLAPAAAVLRHMALSKLQMMAAI